MKTALVCIGIRLPRGSFQPGTPVALSGPGGVYRVQTKPLDFSLRYGAGQTSATADGKVRTGKTMSVGSGLVARNANGVGSRFRATADHMEDASSENDSRPLRQNATRIHSPVLTVAVLETTGNGAPGRLRLDTGPLQVELALGEQWMPSATMAGKPVWRSRGTIRGTRSSRAWDCGFPSRLHPERQR